MRGKPDERNLDEHGVLPVEADQFHVDGISAQIAAVFSLDGHHAPFIAAMAAR
jgi:hypothetical protein